MSVYTSVSAEELRDFLRLYSLGELIEHRGISAGVENTNYFVTTTQGEYVLTLFESHTPTQMSFFLDWMQHLAQNTLPVAQPQRANDGQILQTLNRKPAAIIERVTGENLFALNPTQCAEVGDALARIHVAGRSFKQERQNPYDQTWRQQTAALIRAHLPPDEQALLDHECSAAETLDLSGLPSGIAHTDLFRDNALFHNGKLSAVLDFYDSATETWLYDLAIMVNDWCCDDDGDHNGYLNADKLRSCLSAYHAVRPLTSSEAAVWQDTLRLTALRFWLSRWAAIVTPRDGDMVQQKDPAEFRDKLIARREETDKIRTCWVDSV